MSNSSFSQLLTNCGQKGWATDYKIQSVNSLTKDDLATVALCSYYVLQTDFRSFDVVKEVLQEAVIVSQYPWELQMEGHL